MSTHYRLRDLPTEPSEIAHFLHETIDLSDEEIATVTGVQPETAHRWLTTQQTPRGGDHLRAIAAILHPSASRRRPAGPATSCARRTPRCSTARRSRRWATARSTPSSRPPASPRCAETRLAGQSVRPSRPARRASPGALVERLEVDAVGHAVVHQHLVPLATVRRRY